MRLNFLKNREKRPEVMPFSALRVDVHSHLLPALDEGAKNLEESLELIAELRDLGFQKLILTPHIMAGFYPNFPQKIKERLLILREYLEEKNIDVEVEAAAEYYLDTFFMKELLSNNELMTFDSEGKRYLLFETQHLHQPKQLFEAIKRIFRKEYIPVLAHPERYNYLQRDRLLVHQLYETGLLFQVNINSFSGYYGTESRELADYLSVAQMVSFLGTDCHKQEQIEMLQKTMDSPMYRTVLRAGEILNNRFAN
ncbi:MAG: CpsB/CapC family capsule biosynthesis tyrosine phosphatase [Arcicella sp.]|nr:CpsB/CapC family capsule biosynthesis tyrosine phosphatase [Arcicella sp.]